MTFAVLPFRAAPGDGAGADVAAALTETAFAVEEGKVLWARMASHASVARALQQHTTAKDIATALDVHFLIRGNVSPAAPGYAVELLVVDGANERVLGTRSLTVASRTVTPRERARLQEALGLLTYRALEAEVGRARSKPLAAMDVRDLSFRAYVDWGNKKVQKDEKGAYLAATDLLNRALTLAPDDPLALYLTARVNLCDCVDAWSHNVEVQQAIGAAALEKYLRHDPTSPSMLELKSELYALHGRFDESLVIADSVLQREPEDVEAMSDKAYALLKLGRPQEALVAVNEALDRQHDWPSAAALAAAIHYELAQYDLAAQMANLAITGMSPDELKNPRLGAVRLTLIAAQAKLGHAANARAALADFGADVPGARSIGAIRNWMHPAADLHGYEPLFDGLRLAGMHD